MTNYWISGQGQVLVMAKPDGFARGCSAGDVAKIRNCWRDVLSWLQGADPDEVEHSVVVAAVAQKAALRMPRHNEYDITAWMAEAADLGAIDYPKPRPVPLLDTAGEILASLGFRKTGQYSGWLNRVAIELLYRDSNSFAANRDFLVPALLRGPVAIHYLEGSRIALAHAVKLAIRFALACPASSLTNLVHLDSVTTDEREQITASLTPLDLKAC